jgi:hypothetical protein
MSNQISIAQARSLLLGDYVRVNESSDKHKANVFFNYVDKAASSDTNIISIKEARSLLTEI